MTALRPLPTDPPSPPRLRTDASACSEEIERRLRSSTDKLEDDRLRQELIATNMPMARAVATRYRSRGIPIEDLEQVAYLGLVKAARRFDPSAGHAFSSFCVPTVRGEVRRYFRDHGWMVRPPRRLQELQRRALDAQADLGARLHRSPTAGELATHLGESMEDVLEALAVGGSFSPESLDRPTGAGDTTLGDLLVVDELDLESTEARVVLGPALDRLGERDRLILKLRFVDGRTQREIADDIGVTQMQVSRLLTRIFKDLRTYIGSLDDGDPAARQ